LQEKGTTYLWFGKGATGDERDVAKTVAAKLAKGTVETIFEGKEPKEFWQAIGGKGEYVTVESPEDGEIIPRLFQMSNASGQFTVEEIYNFDQTDLISEDVMMLDCRHEIWLWIGKDALESEKKSALEAVIQYIKSDDTRSQDTPIITVKQGFESPLFKTYFVGWSDEKARAGIVDYEKLKAQMQSGSLSVEEQLKKYSATYSYEVLLERPLPEGVDPSQLENHLKPEEFNKVFGMSKEEFFKIPKWKQTEKKRQKKLY